MCTHGLINHKSIDRGDHKIGSPLKKLLKYLIIQNLIFIIPI